MKYEYCDRTVSGKILNKHENVDGEKQYQKTCHKLAFQKGTLFGSTSSQDVNINDSRRGFVIFSKYGFWNKRIQWKQQNSWNWRQRTNTIDLLGFANWIRTQNRTEINQISFYKCNVNWSLRKQRCIF